MITLEDRLKRNQNTVWRSINGEIVIMNSDGREIHNLNRVGSAVWELSDGKRNMNDIISLICERFDVSFENAKSDVIDFGSEMLGKKLLEKV